MAKKYSRPLKECLATNLEFLIKERQVSGNWIADQAGISNKTVANYRNQVGDPSTGEVEKIAVALGVAVWQLFHPDIRETMPHGEKLLRAYYTATPEGRAFIDRVAEVGTNGSP